MKRLPVLVLLASVVLLCSSAPALEEVTCREEDSAAATRLAVHHINEQHHHGYKFRLNVVQGNKVEKRGGECDIELQLDLLETVCHIVNPKHFEDCELRSTTDREVMANCTVTMTVTADGAKVTKYECVTRQVKTNQEMGMICPDCPVLIPLNSPEGLNAVHQAVKKFNQNTTNQHYYVLQEVGRIINGYSGMAGMSYYPYFVLVETDCPMGSRILPEACTPLCPDRAHHAYCHTSFSNAFGLGSVVCEFYPPVNTTALGPGEREPICRPSHPGNHHRPPFHPVGHVPPPHAGSGGPPPHAHGHGPPPHAGSGGPPPHAHGHRPPAFAGPAVQERHSPRPPFHSCHGFMNNIDPALHPICPWPHPEPRPQPEPRQP
ncbi:alpha-2-HS-glycoprotein 1 [Trachinotus anak]|uniref:alpha-2-HS-glycoprotein 1 n=1 Tax=Trachinotus anak TaxID=443729 RepID=UPI0039F218CE